MTVRCKFRCTSVQTFENSIEVKLQAQYDPDNQDDMRYNKASPNGEMRIWIDNPKVFEFYQPGKQYYIDTIPLEEVIPG